MNDRETWTERLGGRPEVLALAALCYPALALVEAGVASTLDLPGLAWVEPAALLTVPLALLLGPVALVAAGVGVLLAAGATGALGLGVVTTLAATLYLGFATTALAGRLGVHDGGVGRFDWTPARYGLVVGVAGAGAAAVAAWSGVLVGEAVFYVAAPAALVAYAVVPLVTTLPLTAAGRRLPGVDSGAMAPRPTSGGVRRVAVTTLAWLLLGTLGSLGYRSFEVLPADTLRLYGLHVLVPVQEAAPFGPGATRLQVLLGVVAAAVLVVSLRGRPGDGDADTEAADATTSEPGESGVAQ